MARVYTFRCPHCGQADVNVWTRDGMRWYYCSHLQPQRYWNGYDWIDRQCTASNCHVPLLIAKHMRGVWRGATSAIRRWYRGRCGDAMLGDVVSERRG